MYIPDINLMTDRMEIVSFMRQFSFATIITARDGVPSATHLPFLTEISNDELILTSHFAKANPQWKDITLNKTLVIFSEPHAYISTENYEKPDVPTWNYMAVHAYGDAEVISDIDKTVEILEATIDNYEGSRKHWNALDEDYKNRLVKGVVAFKIRVTDLQAKKKISQNRTAVEKQNIIRDLSQSNDSNARLIADYMKKEK